MSKSKYKGLDHINNTIENGESSVITNHDPHYFFQNQDAWPKQSGEILGIGQEMAIINNLFNSNIATSSADTASIVSDLEGLGYSVIMTPTYNGVAEQMNGLNGSVNQAGKFSLDLFDNGTIEASDGFADSGLNGHPYISFVGFSGSSYAGVATMVYTEYSGDTPLKDLFYPNQERSLSTYVLNSNGTTVSNTAGNTSTIYSDNQQVGANGYNLTTKFSADDGSFGFRNGTTRLDGNGGPYLRDGSGSYGCENPNGGDTAASNFYWDTGTSSTNYVFVAFAKFV